MDIPRKYRQLLLPAACIALLLLTLKYLLPLVLPVLLGIGIAAALSPLIRFLQSRLSLGRSLSAGVCVTGVLLLLAALFWLLAKALAAEAGRLYDQLPAIMDTLSRALDAFGRWAQQLAQLLPDGAGDAFSSWAQDIIRSGGTLATEAYERVFSLVSGFLGRLPDTLLFLLTTVLSSYFAAAELPHLQGLCRDHLPDTLQKRGHQLLGSMKTVFSGWLRAQLILMSITFCILLCGFWLLGIRPTLLPALGIAVLDALPLFGTGTILLPWGLFRIIAGDFRLGLGLMILYGVAALSRNVLEPKLLGAQAGVSPLLTLLAIYTGYRLSGFTGMILLPIGVMIAAELFTAAHSPTAAPVETARSTMFPHPLP